MQLELPLADPPGAAQALCGLWEQLSPTLRAALIQRLALTIAKAASTPAAGPEAVSAKETHDE